MPVPAPPPAPLPINSKPVISGTPSTQVIAGSWYSFTPGASDSDSSSLVFSVMGAPAWATFNAATGNLSGTPSTGNVGLTEGIVITVSDGVDYASLPAYSVAVLQNTSGKATVSWLPPFQRTDGSALTNLAAYRIHFGGAVNALNQVVELSNPGLTSYMVEGLTPGTWHFAVTAVDSAGMESALSNTGSKTIL
ncbi:MAG: putative Ig domain-containing protein [Gammaproteobacteria bacterium]